jgi:hypothetical protein
MEDQGESEPESEPESGSSARCVTGKDTDDGLEGRCHVPWQ